MPKVFIIVNELLRGGAQRIILDLAKSIPRDQFALHIVMCKSKDSFPNDVSSLQDEFAKIDIPVISLEGGKRFSFAEFRRLVRLLKKEKPDIVHTFLPYAGTMGRIAAKLAGVRCVISTKCNLPVAYSKKVYWLDKLTLWLADTWIGATEGIELHYGKSSKRFSQKLWNAGRRHFTIVAGVDTTTLQGVQNAIDYTAKRAQIDVPSDATMIFTTARLISWKGINYAIDALHKLDANTHLVIAGWGPQEAELREQANTLGLTDRVHFLGSRDDIYELLAVADIYVQTFATMPDGKLWVGPNTSLIEGAASGIPVVCTHVPLIEQLIEDGITGKLADVNSAESLAQAITWCTDHPKQAQGLARAAQQRVHEKYSITAMSTQTQQLYSACLNQT